MINATAFMTDFRSAGGKNADEASQLKWWILHYIDMKKLVTADEIYKDSQCGDIAMYLALHELVINDLIEGLSPYDDRSKGRNHHEMQYRRAMNDTAMFFSHAAESMSQGWDPTEWDVDMVGSCKTSEKVEVIR